MARRATVVSVVQVDRPRVEVFAYLADVAHHSDWSPKADRVKGVAP